MTAGIFDAIVIGAGGIGSAATAMLARRGAKVLTLDRFPPGHDRGSSHGQTRAIRQAYFEHPDYVPLLLRAYQLWHELEERRSQAENRPVQLYHQTGLLQVGAASGPVISGVLASAKLHRLAIEELSPDEIASRYPGSFRVPDQAVGLFEQKAGYLRVEASVLAWLADAEAAGASIRTGVTVAGWDVKNNQVEVVTDQGTFHAARLIITAGAWASQLLADLNIKLEVRRKHLHWFNDPTNQLAEAKETPVYFFDLPHGFFYGFPGTTGNGKQQGVKIACHTGGERVTDPLTVDRSVDSAELAQVRQFVAKQLPSLDAAPIDHAVCMYTMTPDEDFIVDRHPEHSQVVFAAGLSGHGYKFASVLGEVLAELALDGKTGQPIGFLNCQRPALRK